MQAYEFKLETSERGELLLPLDLQKMLQWRKKARVIFLFEDEEAEWKQAVSSAFLAGYSEKDSAYDAL
ncbi:MAG: hypothetical protein AAB354_13290 [candidate division KSB1 bacterium]